MNLFLENPLPIWALGAVAFAISGLVFFSKRSVGAMLCVAGVIAATLLLVFVERIVVTPAEEVEAAVEELMGSIKSNDLAGVLALIDPAATTVRRDAETLMPQVKIKDATATALSVALDPTASFRGRIDGTHAQNGARFFYFDEIEIDWRNTGAAWQIVDYRAKFRGKTINPVERFRTIR